MAYRVKIGAELEKDIRRLLTTQIGRAVGHLSGVLDDGGSSIHATRKALKRCRSILRLVQPDLSRKDFRQHDQAFRDTARLLSHDRDREVMTQTLTVLSAKAATPDSKAALAAALDELGTLNGHAHNAVIENVDAAIAKLKEAEHAVHSLHIRRAGLSTLAAGYAATYKNGQKALKEAYRAQDDEAFHTYRKSLQHHWRHCQLLAPVWPELMDVRTAAAREQSQLIGLDHDLSLVTNHFRDGGTSALNPQIRNRICAEAKAEQARLRATAKPLAHRLYAQAPRDMERMILKLWPAAKALARYRRKSGALTGSSRASLPLKDTAFD